MEIRPACRREWIDEDAWFGFWINSPIPCCFPANSLVVSNSPVFMRVSPRKTNSLVFSLLNSLLSSLLREKAGNRPRVPSGRCFPMDVVRQRQQILLFKQTALAGLTLPDSGP